MLGAHEPGDASAVCGPFYSASWEDAALARRALDQQPMEGVRVEQRRPEGIEALPARGDAWVVTHVEWVPDATPEGLRPERDTQAFTLVAGRASLIAPADLDREAVMARAEEFLANVSSVNEAERASFAERWLTVSDPAARDAGGRVVGVVYEAPFDLPTRLSGLLEEVAEKENLTEPRRSAGIGETALSYRTWLFVLAYPTATVVRESDGATAQILAEETGRLSASVRGVGSEAEARAQLAATMGALGWGALPDVALSYVDPPCPHGD